MEVEKIIKRAVQSAMKPSYAQVLASGKDPRIESKDLQIQLDTDAQSQLQ